MSWLCRVRACALAGEYGCGNLAEAESDVEMRLPVIEYLQRRVGSASSDDRALMARIGFTDKLGEIANLRITVELTNDKGATTRRTLAFSPFGLNTMNEDLDGREGDSFSSSTLVPMTTKESCEFRKDYTIKYAIGTVNGRNTDLLADGILKR